MPLRTLLLQPKLIHNQLVPSKWSPTQPVLYCAKTLQGEGNIQHPVPIMNDCAQDKKRNRKNEIGQMGY